ncbi:MAG: cytochrome c peroxidase [Bacteroidota bacterium]
MPNWIRNRYTITALLVLICWTGLGLMSPQKTSKLKERALLQAEAFYQQCDTLRLASDAFKFGKIDQNELKRELLATRHAYKRIEYLWEYLYPSYAEEHLNGAPLLHIERHDTRPFVIPPEGLQVLDEMIFADNASAESAQILILAQKLKTATQKLLIGFQIRELSPFEIREAQRMELIRIYTLGLTGFDTPGSGNALAEAGSALAELAVVDELLYEKKDLKQELRASQLFEGAISYLKEHTDFDSFDRLYFLQQYIDPLYGHLLKLGPSNGKSKLVSSWRPESKSLFAKDFLDPYFFAELNEIEDNQAVRELGKRLFFDPDLSASAKMSCGSCHQANQAFTDAKAKSISNIQGQSLSRNTPTLLNAVYADRYFYDLRAFSLEQQAEHVIFNTDEFNSAYEEILSKLTAKEQYLVSFETAFPKQGLNRENLSKALASYVLSLQSFDSPFDQYARGERETIDPLVKQGYNLFMGKAACGTCHFAPTFSGLVPPFYTKNESEILGVPQTPFVLRKALDDDLGRYANGIYSEQADIYQRSFKTTTVRNVAETAPYFHNGSFKSLENVIDFYQIGGGSGYGLDVYNQTLPTSALDLSETEKKALVAFMEALSDNPFSSTTK